MRVLPLAAVVALASLALEGIAGAQGYGPGMPGGSGFGGPPGGGMGGPPGGKKKAPPKKTPEQETHAASNSEAIQSIQTQEPTLPPDPLEIPQWARSRIGTDFNRDVEKGRGPTTERDFYGLYYQEKSGSYRLRSTVPPFWAERSMPNDTASIYGFYYRRRSTNVDADVLFPLIAKLRDKDTHTTVVFPFLHSERKASASAPARHDNWLAPLFFEGSSADGSGYFHAPPLLTFTRHTARDGLNIVGPMFCSWKGGPTCDRRTTDSMDMGLAPFYFYGKDRTSEYEVIPPLLHYYRYNETTDKSTTVWGPYFSQHSPDQDSFNVAPIFFRSTGKNEASTTIAPFFHYSYKGNANLLVVAPFFLKGVNDKGDTTFASLAYASYRGRTELDMYSPFVWRYGDPDIGLVRWFGLPFFYKADSPRTHDLAILPFYARFKSPGIRTTTWVTPLFRHATDVTGWETDIYPFFFMGRNRNVSHLVVAPFLWDFASPTSRTTVVAPVFVRRADQTSISQLAFNTYYHEKKVAGGSDWEFHFFPAFSYGQSPTGYWWNVLYGLAGYTREGTASRIRALYIPIPISN